MSTCSCCGNKRAFVMKPLCDRCFLGWNGDCCEIRKAIDQASEDNTRHACEEMGHYRIEWDNPFRLERIRAIEEIRTGATS